MGIGFNILPNISLGDMEAVMDIANEVEVMSEQKSITRTELDKDEILKRFTLSATQTGVKTDKSTKVEQEKQIESIKNKLINNTVSDNSIYDDEIKLKERLKAAEEQRIAEENRIKRIKQLEEEARIAEQEAELASKKREAEQRRIEEEQRLRQLKADEEARKREEKIREQRRIEEQRLERIRQEQEKLDRMRAEQARIDELQRQEQIRLENQRREQERKEQIQKEELIRQIKEQKKREEDAKKAKQAKASAAQHVQTTRADTIGTGNKNIDKLKSEIINQEIRPAASYEKYSQLDVEALYAEVRKFLKKHNVEKKIVDIKILEDEFGKPNIKKLILKSYLISIGKGVTVGR